MAGGAAGSPAITAFILFGVFGRAAIQCSHQWVQQQGQAGQLSTVWGGCCNVVNPLVVSVAAFLWWMRVAEGSGWQTCSV
jgi:hypothetical protein